MTCTMSACMRRSSMNDCGNTFALSPSSRLIFQICDGHTAAAFFLRRRSHARHERVTVEKFENRFSQPARAEAVNQPNRALVGQQALVEKLLETVDRLVHGVANEQQLARNILARLH